MHTQRCWHQDAPPAKDILSSRRSRRNRENVNYRDSKRPLAGAGVGVAFHRDGVTCDVMQCGTAGVSYSCAYS